VIEIHAGTETGAEWKHIRDLASSDRRPESLRYLVAVDRRYRGRIEHRLDAYLTPSTAQELHQVCQPQRAAVLAPTSG
jgi:hypothetical protein